MIEGEKPPVDPEEIHKSLAASMDRLDKLKAGKEARPPKTDLTETIARMADLHEELTARRIANESTAQPGNNDIEKDLEKEKK